MAKFLNFLPLMAVCCDAMEAIERQCGGNVKALQTKLHVVCVDDVVSIPAPSVDHTVTTDISMVATKVFTPWTFSKTNNNYVAEPQGEGDSKYWLTKVTVFFPKITPKTTKTLNGVANGEYIVIIKDKNGHNRIIGKVGDGASISVGEQTNDVNGYPVTLEWETSELPLFYTGVIPV